MTTVSDHTVRKQVQRILKGADLDSISERNIKDQIAQTYGDVEPFKDLIREEIESFLEAIQQQDVEDEPKTPPAKRKAAGKAESQPQAKSQKKASTPVKAAAVKEDPAADANEEEEEKEGAGAEGSNGLPVKLSTNRRADISEFKGKTYVSIREYYEKDGEQLPAKKGISLNPEQFNVLNESSGSINTALQAADTDFKLALSQRRSVRINVFKGTAMVDIREMYEKDGEELPGKKGISLNTEQWTALMRGLSKLNAAI